MPRINLRNLALSTTYMGKKKSKSKTNIGSKWKLDPKILITRKDTRDHLVQLTSPHP